jgi:pSer/pThr/pTyr-binding forkhead associated (FHA) protein
MINLYVTLRGHSVGRFDIEGDRVRVGRNEDNEVQIDSMAISRHHCVMERDAGGWMVRDLGSHNGTNLNGTRIEGSQPVRHGDTLEVGHFHISVSTDEATQSLEDELPRAPSVPLTKSGSESRQGPVAAEHAAKRKGFLILHNRPGPALILERDLLQIGSHPDADVPLPGPRKLALVVRGYGGFQVINVGPLGDEVRVNGQTVEDRAWLKDGDELKLGDLELRFHEGLPLRDESTLTFDAPTIPLRQQPPI